MTRDDHEHQGVSRARRGKPAESRQGERPFKKCPPAADKQGKRLPAFRTDS